MPESFEVRVNGAVVRVDARTTAAGAIARAGSHASRRSVTGEPRGPMCGMGICYECRATLDGVAHVRTCQVLCRPGMVISTDAR